MAIVVVLCLLAMAGGCGKAPYELAPVSGVVTLYGEPLANATVSFEPNGNNRDESIVGPGSVGTTDENGRYELRTFKQESGAVVGNHLVRISTYKSEFEDIKQSDKIKVISVEHVPWHYNRNSGLTCDVPAGGTDEANFALTARE